VWQPATPDQQRDSLEGVVAVLHGPLQLVGEGEGDSAAPSAAGPRSAANVASSLASASALGSSGAISADALFDAAAAAASLLGDGLEEEEEDAAYAATVGAPAVDAALEQQHANLLLRRRRLASSASSADTRRLPTHARSANIPRAPHLARSSGRALHSFGGGGGGGGLPPTTSASHAAPVKVGACGLAELSGGSALASPEDDGVGYFGWSLAVNKGADVMVVGQPAADIDVALYADVVQLYADDTIGAAFVFAAVGGGGGGAGISLNFAKSCSFADQRLVNPVWRVDKAVVGFGTEVAVSYKGDTALSAGRIVDVLQPVDDEPVYSSDMGSDNVWAFRKGVTGYVQFSRQELPLVNPPVGDEKFSDDGVYRRVMALGLSHDGGLAMAAYVSVCATSVTTMGGCPDEQPVGGSVQVFGSTKERFLLTQVIGPPPGSRVPSWAVSAAMSADGQTIVACDGSGEFTLVEDAALFDSDVYLTEGSGVFVYARTDGLQLTKPDGKVGLVQANATANYALAGLLRPPLWTEELDPGVYDATATFGTAVAVTAKAKFIAVVERRYVKEPAEPTLGADYAAPAGEDGGGGGGGGGGSARGRRARRSSGLHSRGRSAAQAGTADEDNFYIAHFVHVYQRVEGTGKGLTAMYALKCTLDDPDPHRYAPFGYGRHQLAIATNGKQVTVAIGSQPSTGVGDEADLPTSVYVYRIVAGQHAGKGEDICPFEPEFVVDDPMFVAGGAGAGGDPDAQQPSLFGEAVALSANGKVLVVGQPQTGVVGEAGGVYLYDLRKPVKRDVYVGNAPLVGVGGYARRKKRR
jgi:hypothetical protein